jgi:hypothetical protein
LSKIFGMVILFAAAWLMYRLQARGGCCNGGNDRSVSDKGLGQSCCGETHTTSAVDKENKIEN